MLKSRASFFLVAFIMALVGGLCASGWMAVAQEIQPVQAVVTAFETPISFLIVAEEVAENYEFEFLSYPANGVIVGIPPQLVYVPNPGFYGRDSAEIAVYAKDTGQLVNVIPIQILVLSPKAEVSPPSWGFTGDVTIGPPLHVEGTFTALYHQKFRYFTEDISAAWEKGAFNSLRSTTHFTLLLPWDTLSMKFPITSTLKFDPSVPKFEWWDVRTSTDLLGWTLGFRFHFESQTNSYTELTAHGKLDGIDSTARVKFRNSGTGTEFSEFSLTNSGTLNSLGCTDCNVKWKSGLSFTKTEGLEKAYFELLDIPILTCCLPKVLLDTTVTFTSGEKTLEPSLRIVSGWEACLKPLFSLEFPPVGFGIAGIELYGFELRCDFPNGVTGRFATSFDPSKDGSVTGDSHFFELWQLSGPFVSCCGGPTKWQSSIYFTREPGFLLGVGRMDMIVYVHLSPELLIYLNVKVGQVDPSDPTKTWLIKFGWRGLL